MDPLVAVLAHQQVLTLLAVVGTLITHDARLAVVTSPTLSLKIPHQLVSVDSAAGMDTLAAVMTRHQGLSLSSRVGCLSAKTLRTDGDLLRLLRLKTGIRL